jgi:hypothetical protein
MKARESGMPDAAVWHSFFDPNTILAGGGHVAVIHWNYDPQTPRGPPMAIRPRPEIAAAGLGRSGSRPRKGTLTCRRIIAALSVEKSWLETGTGDPFDGCRDTLERLSARCPGEPTGRPALPRRGRLPVAEGPGLASRA